MTPTLYMRFIERTETIDAETSRTVKVLQQFWETPSGSEVAEDMFVRLYGKWVDVPLVKEAK